jgi:hypothetical protein
MVGFAGAVIALVSLVLPWWTMTLVPGRTLMGYHGVREVSIYVYKATTTGGGSVAVSIGLWYGWVTLVLAVIGGLLGVAGSVRKNSRVVLFAGGLLKVLSVTIFAAGLQSELSKSTVIAGYPIVGLFSSGSGFLGYVSYTSYLSFGFWLTLAAAIVMLVTSTRKAEISADTPAST